VPAPPAPGFPGLDAAKVLTPEVLGKALPGQPVKVSRSSPPVVQGPRSWTSGVDYTDGQEFFKFTAALSLRSFRTPEEAVAAVDADRRGLDSPGRPKPGAISDSPRSPGAFVETQVSGGMTSKTLSFSEGSHAATLTLMSSDAAVADKVLDLSRLLEFRQP
jgi:hypothetical protein